MSEEGGEGVQLEHHGQSGGMEKVAHVSADLVLTSWTEERLGLMVDTMSLNENELKCFGFIYVLHNFP